MDTIDSSFQRMRADARDELINRIAVHEAGHFVMMLLLMRQSPYHIVLTPETGSGMTLPFCVPDSPVEHALIMMAGYAAERLFDTAAEDTGLGDYMYHDDYDNQDFLNMCRELGGTDGVKADYYVFELESFQAAKDILKNHKSFIFALATELKNSEKTEMDYAAIKTFCRKYQKEFPVIKTITFPDPSSHDEPGLQNEIGDYKKNQTIVFEQST